MTAADPSLADAPVLRLTAPLGELTSADVSRSRTPAPIARSSAAWQPTSAGRTGSVRLSRRGLRSIPDGFLLEPGQEGRVRVSLALEASRYDPRHLYVGAIQVLRHGDARLDIPLDIIATDPLAADETSNNAGQGVQHGAA